MRTPVLAALSTLALASCSDATGPEHYAGAYLATVFEFRSADDPTQTVDLIQYGLSVGITITADGTFTVHLPNDTESGTIAIDGSDVTLTMMGLGPATGVINRTDGTVTLHFTHGVLYDFSDDTVRGVWPTRAQDEDATLRIVMHETPN